MFGNEELARFLCDRSECQGNDRLSLSIGLVVIDRLSEGCRPDDPCSVFMSLDVFD